MEGRALVAGTQQTLSNLFETYDIYASDSHFFANFSPNPLVHLSLCGESNHSEIEDSDRRIFELSKVEFSEEKICEFCCQSFGDEEQWTSHKEKVNDIQLLAQTL